MSSLFNAGLNKTICHENKFLLQARFNNKLEYKQLITNQVGIKTALCDIYMFLYNSVC